MLLPFLRLNVAEFNSSVGLILSGLDTTALVFEHAKVSLNIKERVLEEEGREGKTSTAFFTWRTYSKEMNEAQVWDCPKFHPPFSLKLFVDLPKSSSVGCRRALAEDFASRRAQRACKGWG